MELPMKNDFKAYRELANAIVRQACEDYTEALRVIHGCQTGTTYRSLYLILADGINKGKNLKKFKISLTKTINKILKAEGEIYECEEFFYSDRFAILTDMNPDYIIDRINNIIEKE